MGLILLLVILVLLFGGGGFYMGRLLARYERPPQLAASALPKLVSSPNGSRRVLPRRGYWPLSNPAGPF
jgi:hypothetical protein